MWCKLYFCLSHVNSNLTNLQLIHPDVVLVSLLIGLGLLFMVMFAGILLVLALVQSGLLLYETCLKLAFWFCQMGVTWSLSLFYQLMYSYYLYMPLSLLYMVWKFCHALLALCIQMSSNYSVPFIIFFQRYCSMLLGCCICVLCSVILICHFYHSDNVWPPGVATLVSLFNEPMYPLSPLLVLISYHRPNGKRK